MTNAKAVDRPNPALQIIADHFGDMSPLALKGKGQSRFADRQRLAIYLLREMGVELALIAKIIDRAVADCEAACEQIKAARLLNPQLEETITCILAALGDLPEEANPAIIMQAVACHLRVTNEELRHGNSMPALHARQIYIYLLSEAAYTKPEIGEFLARSSKDVNLAIQAIQREKRESGNIQDELRSIRLLFYTWDARNHTKDSPHITTTKPRSPAANKEEDEVNDARSSQPETIVAEPSTMPSPWDKPLSEIVPAHEPVGESDVNRRRRLMACPAYRTWYEAVCDLDIDRLLRLHRPFFGRKPAARVWCTRCGKHPVERYENPPLCGWCRRASRKPVSFMKPPRAPMTCDEWIERLLEDYYDWVEIDDHRVRLVLRFRLAIPLDAVTLDEFEQDPRLIPLMHVVCKRPIRQRNCLIFENVAAAGTFGASISSPFMTSRL